MIYLTAARINRGTSMFDQLIQGLTNRGHAAANRARNRRGQQSGRYRPSLECLEDRLAPAGFFASGAGAGGAPAVRVFDAQTGQELSNFLAFDSSFTGGVHVAVADVSGDGVEDIIAAAGAGGAPHVKVFNGRTLALLASFLAYDASFTGGVNVAGGDLNHDGIAEIITGAGAGGGPHVRVFDLVNGEPVQITGPAGSFMAYDPAFFGGVTVASGNVDGSPGDDIVTGAGPGGGPHVKVFDHNGIVQRSFFAYDTAFHGGVFVAAGDFNNDRQDDVVTGAGSGGGPHVQVFNGRDGAVLASFLAYDAAFAGGVRVAAADVNGDNHSDIVTGAGPNGGPHAQVFDGQTLRPITSVSAFDSSFGGGIFSAAAQVAPAVGNGQLAELQAPLISRLARFVPNTNKPYTPSVKDWVAVSPNDSNLKGNVYVVAHGFAYGYQAMVKANSTPGDPLKWWETQDTSLPQSPGSANASEMFDADPGITPSGLASAILAADPKAVVLAYSWLEDAAYDYITGNATSEAFTHMNGVRLARALETALPTSFHSDGGNLHLIGHSHGSKVATVAAVTLQRFANPNLGVAHLTILDSPEDSPASSLAGEAVFETNASNSLWYFLGALKIGRSSGSTFVDNYISYLDNDIGPIQGFDPLTASTTNKNLQQIVDVDITAGPSVLDLGKEDSHSYAFNWYSGAAQKWDQNPKPEVVLGGQPVLKPDPTNLAGHYAQSWTTNTEPQFALTPGPQSKPTTNTQSITSTFTTLTLTGQQKTKGVTYDSTMVKLKDDGTNTESFSGKFVPVGGLFSSTTFSGISFNYQFTNPGANDQLLINVNTGYFGANELHYVMNSTVAGGDEYFATLSLGSLAHERNGTIQIELVPGPGSTGAEVKIYNLQQYTIPA